MNQSGSLTIRTDRLPKDCSAAQLSALAAQVQAVARKPRTSGLAACSLLPAAARCSLLPAARCCPLLLAAARCCPLLPARCCPLLARRAPQSSTKPEL